MKTNKLVILGVAILSLASCGEKAPTSAEFTLANLGNNIEFHTQVQLDRFINNKEQVLSSTVTLPYLDGLSYREDYSRPNAIELSWEVKTDQGSLKDFSIQISENQDLSSAYYLTSNDTEVSFINPKINTTYYWRVSSGDFQSSIASFKTNDTFLRNIDIDGIKNVRDLGGYGHIKQGLIYRGAAFETYDDKTGVTVNITDQGKQTVLNQLGIKTEVDLRKDDDSKENCEITASEVSGVAYLALPMYYGGNNIVEYKDDNFDNPARIKDFFYLLSNISNYPVYFHCVHGKDRTGALAYTIEALLGVEEDYLYLDYLFSNFAQTNYNMKPSGIDGNYGKTYHNYLKDDTTLTLSERVYRYLHEVVGVPTETLDSVIYILSDK